jgi:mono/diheme cytochrome c family protein
MTRIARLPALTAALLCTLASACAGGGAGTDEEAAAIGRGKALAEAQCAQCHAIGATGMSPYPAAPIWREMVQTKDTDELATLFGEGKLIHRDGIASMPEFTLTPQQIGELIAYMKTLRAG